MQPELLSLFARERHRDDSSALEPEPDAAAPLDAPAITIRTLNERDWSAVERLASLEERPVPPGPLLVAEVDGAVEAAVAVDGGEAVADPFAPSEPAVSLLRLRAAQVRG